MAINKVVIDGETKLDLTSDTITADQVAEGVVFHDKTGESLTGTRGPTVDELLEGTITKLKIGASTIADGALMQNRTIEEITFVEGKLTSIGDNTFGGMQALKAITLPDGLVSIGVNAFANCLFLTSLAVPDSVTSIGGGFAMMCTSITSVVFPKNLTTLPETTCNYLSALTSITFPENLESIGMMSFQNEDNLESVVFPDSLKTIGSSSFSGCPKLSSVTFSSSLSSIESSFSTCALTSVTFRGATPPSGLGSGEQDWTHYSQDTWEPAADNVTVTVPSGSLAAYQACGALTDWQTTVENAGGTFTWAEA